MTIVLTLGNADQVVQVSDRRLSSNGRLIDDDAFKGIEAMIRSMTTKERKDYKIIDISRKKRIASGAGVEVTEVNSLIKQFVDMRKMMKLMSNKQNMMAMMKNLKNAGGINR